jgi:hypothetical protein
MGGINSLGRAGDNCYIPATLDFAARRTIPVRCQNKFAASLAVPLCAAWLAMSPPAAAQTAPLTPPPSTGPYGMPMSDWQGLSCLWGGVLGGAGVYYYSDVLTIAATGATNPLLAVPLIATGFIGGCTIGTNAAAGFVWIARHL